MVNISCFCTFLGMLKGGRLNNWVLKNLNQCSAAFIGLDDHTSRHVRVAAVYSVALIAAPET